MASRSDSPTEPQTGRPIIEPSKLGQFIALDGCPQFYKYEFDESLAQQRRREKAWKEAFEPLSLLLAAEGREFEHRMIDTVESPAHGLVDHGHITEWERSQSALKNAISNARDLSPKSGPLLVTQPRFGLEIEAWGIAGDADLVVLWPTCDDGVRIRILEIKASHEEKTYHQIQTATYAILCRQFMAKWDPEFPWTIEAGIVHRGTDITDMSPDALPSFPLDSRELDVRRLLKPGGRFDELWARDSEQIRYQLAPKCYNCTYKESCFTDAIENEKPALLGLSRGEQQTLASAGVETLHDLAELAYPPADPKPYEYDALTPVDRDRYDRLLNEPGIGQRLDRYIQEAQSLLSELDPTSTYTSNTDTRVPFILGSGDGNLPEDDPPFTAELGYDRGTLIRCYIHVEWDHRRDRILMLSGYVTASATDHTRSVSVLTHDITASDLSPDETEERVLREFFTQIFDAIRSIAAEMNMNDEAAFHFYFYTHDEYEAVIGAVTRHEAVPVIDAVRDLFGLRGPIDQQMVTVIRDEIQSRIALPTPNSGLLPVMEYFRPDEDFFPQTAWKYTRPDDTTVDLRSAFHRKLFDYRVAYERSPSGITLYPEDEPDGYYPSRARQGSHIPLEYVWAALGRWSDDSIDADTRDPAASPGIAAYRWVDSDDKSTRLTRADVKALGRRLANCLAHVERGIHYRNPTVPKEPLDLDNLSAFSLGDPSISRACIEYLQLEYSSQRSELLRHYALPVKQRIRRGDSIPFVVTHTMVTERGDLKIDGHLLYDQLFEDGDRVASSCRQKGAQGATGGSWMVVNELDRQGDPIRSRRPSDVERGVGVSIDALDIDNREIKLTAIAVTRWRDQEFTRRHRDWTVSPSDEDDHTVCIEENRIFILDPRTDDLTAQRAYDLLQYAEHNFVCQTLGELAAGTTQSPEIPGFAAGPTTEFINWLERSYPLSPNEAQQGFISDTTSQFSLLQGPPGTGKTSAALALAILARVVAFAGTQRSLAGVVCGESNKAVDEILAGVADVYEAYQADPETDSALLDRLRLVRLTHATPAQPHDAVEYVDYHTDQASVRSLASQLLDDDPASASGPNSFDTTDQGTLPHALVFGTPARIYGLMNHLDAQTNTAMAPSDWLRRGRSFFDLLAVDEASMVRLPSFTLAGAFLKDTAQVLIAGDQRQLPPVQHHDWARETRRTVTAFAPQLSTLDYFRALNGHDLPGINARMTAISGDAACPMYRLEHTYRCHESLASLLTRYVYAQDNITLRSNETGTLHPPAPTTEPVQTILDPDRPLVLVMHGERSSQQSNPTEAALCRAIVDAVHDADDPGIVTPHNAQRGLLTARLSDDVEVDTVERYQGGERDCILVSATASDPDFLAAEQDFILNPNRLNVAMSRMKRKLVVVASASVFDLVPPDVREYDRARLWKGIYHEMGVLDRAPAWYGTISEIVGERGRTSNGSDIPVAVYAPPHDGT